jgi:hypothetical protein
MAYELIISDPGANMTYVLAHTDGSRTLVQGKSRICLSRSELRRLNESADRSESQAVSPSKARLMGYSVVPPGQAV